MQPLQGILFQQRPESARREARRDLDVGGIPIDAGTPIVKYVELVRDLLNRRERMPDGGVLGYEPECLLFALSADEDRDVPRRGRNQQLPPATDAAEVVAQIVQP